jgi:transposase-like protein
MQAEARAGEVASWMDESRRYRCGKGPPGALTTVERDELVRLRREYKRLEMERDILKAAATYFARESK